MIAAIHPEHSAALIEKLTTAPAGTPVMASGENPAIFKARCETWMEYCQKIADEANGLRIDSANGIAVQPINGYLAAGCGPVVEAFCDCFDTNRIAEAAAKVAQSTGVRALVLAVNSPGGYAQGVRQAAESLVALKAARPDIQVMACITGMGCSGAAWLAAAADESHAIAASYVGSISTILIIYDSSKMFERIGVTAHVFTDGEYKSMGREGVPLTEKQRKYLDDEVQASGAEFKSFMRARRPGLTDEDMQGQPFEASPGRYPEALLDSAEWKSLDEFLSAVAEGLS